ncbi:MAG TPA: hypothetical protein GX717_06715, partial [Clostridiaceae bacterium]|nr:hypothetical protein [Clostridiaceae bacterium]
KVFGVGFRTPPLDSTGAAHIVEHCVLSGSRRYKTKEPFMDMLKGSLQTFLNAMTFPDKTIYPVASRNTKDYYHLMDLYLDAVFYPAIYNEPKIFKQEGWHYEWVSPTDGVAIEGEVSDDAELGLSGVVYNEMKGVYSDPSSVLLAETMAGLYPDTPYGYESGGHPAVIPELSEAEFLDFHRRYYHPSNSYLFMYGNIDLADRLAYIDAEYLGHFEELQVDSGLVPQTPFNEPRRREVPYSLPAGEDPIGKHYASWSVCAPPHLPTIEQMRLEILCEVLFENAASPIREYILKEGLAEDVFSFSETLYQSFCGVGMVNARAEGVAAFADFVKKQLQEIVAAGIDRKQLEAALNRLEFSRRECDGATTRGVRYFIQVFETWLYDQDPLAALRFADDVDQLRKDLDSDAYEQAVQQYFIDNPHTLVVDCYPEIGLNERQEADLRARLSAYKETLTETEIHTLIEQQKEFQEWQRTPDSKEDLATIPRLSLTDVERDILQFSSQTKEVAGCPVVTVPLFTGGTVYAELCFGLNGLAFEDLAIARLYTALLTNLATEQHSYQELESEIYLQSGGVNVSLKQYEKRTGTAPELYMVVSAKALVSQWPKTVDLLKEILETTRFDDLNRIKEELVRLRARYELQISTAGHIFAMQRSQAYVLSNGVINDAIAGLAFYDQLCDYLNRWDEVGEELAGRFALLSRQLINRYELNIGLTAAETDLPGVVTALEPLVSTWPARPYKKQLVATPLGINNEGFGTASQVQYVAQTFNFGSAGIDYDGSMQVATALLSLDYLHNKIRAQGGAYGAGLVVSDRGYVSSYSYRDPHLERTLSAYRDAGQYLSQLATTIDRQTLEVAIIGTMSAFNPPLTAQNTGRLALQMFMTGKDREVFITYMNQALATTVEDLLRFGDMLYHGFNDAKAYTVVGNQNVIAESPCFTAKYAIDPRGLRKLS